MGCCQSRNKDNKFKDYGTEPNSIRGQNEHILTDFDEMTSNLRTQTEPGIVYIDSNEGIVYKN